MLRLVIIDLATVVKTTNEGPATIRVLLDEEATPADLALVVASFARDSASAGIRVVEEYSPAPFEDWFRLDDPAHGLDSGAILTDEIDA